jgi:hypothetical protein
MLILMYDLMVAKKRQKSIKKVASKFGQQKKEVTFRLPQ